MQNLKTLYVAAFICFLLSSSCHVNAQVTTYQLPDSLSQLLQKNNKHDTARINALARVIDALTDELIYEEALPYIKEIKELSGDLHDNYGKALGNYYFGVYNAVRLLHKESFSYLNNSLNIAKTLEETAKNQNLIIRIYVSLSTCYIDMDMLDKAYEQIQKGLELSRKLGLEKQNTGLKNNLAIIYFYLGQHEKAISIYKELLMEHTLSQAKKAGFMNNIGINYKSLKQYDSAFLYLNSALNNTKMNKNKLLVLNSLGGCYRETGNYSEAEKFFNEGLRLSAIENNIKVLITTRTNLVRIKLLLHKFDTALILANASIKQAQQYKLITNEKDAILVKIDILEATNRFKEGLILFHDYLTVEQRLNEAQNIEKTNELLLKEEILKKEKEMELEQLQLQYNMNVKHQKLRNIYYGIAICLFVALLIVLFWLNRKDILLKKKKIEEEVLTNALKLRDNELKFRDNELKMQSLELELLNRELTSNVLMQVQKNEALSDVVSKLSVLNADNDNPATNLNSIVHDLKQSINENVRKDFDYYFVQVHADFYEKLLADFPNLSRYDQHLCAFVRLNLTTKDIATIKNISPDSVKTARKRLRKTLGITNPDDSLIDFLSKY